VISDVPTYKAAMYLMVVFGAIPTVIFKYVLAKSFEV